MAGNKNQFPFFRTLFRPLQIFGGLHWFIVFISSKQGKIQAIARVGEVVRIPAERGDGFFRCKHKTNIVVLFVLVQMVLTARVKGDHITAIPCPRVALLFDIGHVRFASFIGHFQGQGVGDTGLHFGRYIFHGKQNIDFQIRALFFLGVGTSQKTVDDVIVFLGPQLRNTLRPHMMIGEQKSLRGNK